MVVSDFAAASAWGPGERPPSNDVEGLIDALTARAQAAARRLAVLPSPVKDGVLRAMATAVRAHRADLLAANRRDLEAGREAGLSAARLDRLALDERRIEAMATALEAVASLDDPVGEITDVKVRPNGLRVGRMRVPIGVIAVIYEARPHVTADAGALCLKAGNAVILRGGHDAFHSNLAIAQLLETAGRRAGLPEGALQLVPTPDRAAVTALLQRHDRIDVVIPRGGRSLIEAVVATARMPVLKHYDGNCFVYVDRAADPAMARAIVLNAKTQRPGVCNAAESLLIHAEVAATLGVDLVRALQAAGVEVRADARLRALLPELPEATPEDWRTEYLDLILTAGVVESLDAAIAFINTHGSHHTDAIVTSDYQAAMRFLAEVDSACVFVNCSTRLSDGGEFGMGCEIGISTDKLHARGPMGVRELTTQKFIAFGDGQLRT